PSDLEAPERTEGAARPRDVAALVGHGGGQLRHDHRHGAAPQQGGDDEKEKREAGTEGRDDILDPVGAAAHVKEDEGDERPETEIASKTRRRKGARPAHLSCAAAISFGRSLTHSSIGVSASTTISNFPLGSTRTRPGVAGPSGIVSFSRWMPRASVTAKMASISFMVTTSSITLLPGRRRPRARTRRSAAMSRPRRARPP